MSLTDLEKAAGRKWRASCQRVLDELSDAEPAGGGANPLLRVIRHPCAARGGASVGIELREHYLASPELWVCYCGVIEPCGEFRVFPHDDCDGGKIAAAAGLFCWIWKDGRCLDCELVLRSRHGLIDLAASRPPERERAVA
jgi:hypothetical protein